MYKSRKGAALILALVVVLIGGTVTAITFNMMYKHAWMTSQQKNSYVNHTTLLSFMQEMKGRIISDNIAADETRHALALGYDTVPPAPPAAGTLTIDDLRFGPPWYVESDDVRSGVGVQRVTVEVYDVFFDLDWVNPIYLTNKDFPPSFKMAGIGGGGSAGEIEGDATSASGGTYIGSYTSDNLPSDRYGAYLVRAKLYNNKSTKPIRVTEELFVQILPES